MSVVRTYSAKTQKAKDVHLLLWLEGEWPTSFAASYVRDAKKNKSLIDNKTLR